MLIICEGREQTGNSPWSRGMGLRRQGKINLSLDGLFGLFHSKYEPKVMPGSAWPHWIPSDGRDDPEMEISGMPLPACHSGIVSGCSWWWGWLLWDYQSHFTGGEASARNKPSHGEGGGCALPELMMLFISILTARARWSCRHPAGGRTRLL